MVGRNEKPNEHRASRHELAPRRPPGRLNLSAPVMRRSLTEYLVPPVDPVEEANPLRLRNTPIGGLSGRLPLMYRNALTGYDRSKGCPIDDFIPKGLYPALGDTGKKIIDKLNLTRRAEMTNYTGMTFTDQEYLTKWLFPTGKCEEVLDLAKNEWGKHNHYFHHIRPNQYFKVIAERGKQLCDTDSPDCLKNILKDLFTGPLPKLVKADNIFSVVKSHFKVNVQINARWYNKNYKVFSHFLFGLGSNGNICSMPDNECYVNCTPSEEIWVL